MKIIRELAQGTDAWRAWRREGLGGSDIAAILGLSPYEDATRESIFADKVHGVEREANFAMHRGTRLEPHARLVYQTRRRVTAPAACVEMDGFPWARVSLDGLCSDNAVIDPVRWILELKAPNWETHSAALAGCVPEHFLVQLQWQMLVCGLQKCDFASFNPSARFTPGGVPKFELWASMNDRTRPAAPADWLAVVEIEADAAKQAEILSEAGRFWYEVLEAREAKRAEVAKRDRSSVEAEFV